MYTARDQAVVYRDAVLEAIAEAAASRPKGRPNWNDWKDWWKAFQAWEDWFETVFGDGGGAK